LIDCSI